MNAIFSSQKHMTEELENLTERGRSCAEHLYSTVLEYEIFRSVLKHIADVAWEVEENVKVNYWPVRCEGFMPTPDELQAAGMELMTPPENWLSPDDSHLEAMNRLMAFDAGSFSDAEMTWSQGYSFYSQLDAAKRPSPVVPEVLICLGFEHSVSGNVEDSFLYVSALGGDIMRPDYPAGLSGTYRDLEDGAWGDQFREACRDTISRMAELYW